MVTSAERDDQGCPIAIEGIVTDITERVQAEEALRENEKLLRKIAENYPNSFVAIIENDFSINFTGGKEFSNYDLVSDQFVGMTLEQILYEKKNIVLEYYKKTFQGEECSFEFSIGDQHQYFRTVPLYADDGSIPRILTVVENITSRKQAERALQESENKMRSIFRVAPTGIGMVKNRVLQEVNFRICEMTGYTKEELIGRSARLMYPSQKEFEFVGQEKYRQITEYGTGVVETRWQKKDGSIIDILLTSTPINVDDQSKGVTFTALDITERKQAEAALLLSEVLQRTSLDAFEEAIHLIDPEFSFQLVNRGFKDWAERFGFEADVIGRRLPEVFPLLPEEIIEQYQQVLKTGEPLQTIEETKIGGQSIFTETRKIPILADGKVTGVLTILADITNRKQAEETLWKNEERFRELFERMPSGVAVYEAVDDGEDFVFKDFNRGAEKIEKIKREAVIGKRVTKIFPGVKEFGLFKVFQKVWKTGKADFFEKAIYTDDRDAGSWRENWVYKLPYGDIVSVYADITKRKQAEDAIQHSQERLRLLHEIDVAILAAETPEKIAESLIERFRQFMGCQRMVVATLKNENNSFNILALDADEGFKDFIPENAPHDRYQDVIEKLSQGEIIKMTNRKFRVEGAAHPIDKKGLLEGILIPLMSQNRLIGSIIFGYEEPDDFTSEREELARQVANQLAIAIWQAQLTANFQASRNRAKTLAQKVITTQEDERRLISRELHDESGQMLTALKVQLELLGEDVPPEMGSLKSQLQSAADLVADTMANLRNLAHGLRPPVLDTMGLEITLKDMCQDFGKRAGLTINLKTEKIPELPEVAQITLYRILQEALTNIAKHSKARNVEVQLKIMNTELSLTVKDDGVGFEANQTRAEDAAKSGIGLIGMSERMELIGGVLNIESAPGMGTTLEAVIPVNRDFIERRKERK